MGGSLGDSAEVVHTPTLDAKYTSAPTVGSAFQVRVSESGPYSIELRSYDFDAYLVLLDSSENALAEDDDGLIGTHALLAQNLEANHDYRVIVCALHGARGKFQMEMRQGLPPELSREEKGIAEEADWRARIAHIEVSLDTDTAEYSTALRGLGQFFFRRGEYSNARHQFERALAINEKVLGPKHPDTAAGLNFLASTLRVQGSYEEARVLYERALAVFEETLGPTHPGPATILNNLAYLIIEQGNFEEALPLYERAHAIWMEVLGPKHPYTATSLNNIALLLKAQGNYEEARPLYERALAIREEVLGSKHRDTAASLNNLALLLREQGNYEEARPLYERALALLFKAQGNYDEARPLYERAQTIYEEVLGPKHRDTANSLHNLALLLSAQGNYEEARPLNERALAVFEEVLGPKHPDTAISLNSLASLLKTQGNYEEARPLFERALSSSLDYLGRELPTLSEAGRHQLLQVTVTPARLLSCLSYSPPAAFGRTYSLFQRWKGKATRLQVSSLRLGLATESADIRRRKGRIQVTAKQLSNLVMLPLADQEEDHADRISKLRTERIRLERELNRDLGLDLVMGTPALAEVQAGMAEGTTLVDFFVGEEVYAWVLAPQGEPQLFSLGSADSMRSAQEGILRNTAIRGGRTLSENGNDSMFELLEKLWAPLREAVGDASTVFVSPDGFLCELPFGILQEEDGSYLLEKHRFVYLSDPTRLAQASEGGADVEGSLLAIGGIDYFLRDDPPEIRATAASTRSRVRDSWDSLPATKLELQSLRDLHDSALEWESPMTVIEGKAATEERIRAELPGHRYVHIATHGYFEPDHLPSLLVDAEEKLAKAQLGEQIKAVGLLPGLLSGLVFAGVNGEADPARDDGYLSAEEIQHLDLSACDLVVLSACETALGSARAGEGLMSMRRAFSVAGVDTVISSLWKVEDEATATLIKDFYTNLWMKGLSRSEALHQARLRMLRLNRLERDGNAKPSTWGAFVLSGEWN